MKHLILAALAAVVSTGARSAYFESFAVPAMSNVKRMPDVRPVDAFEDGVVRIVVARDEFEPGSFVLKANRDLGKVPLTLTPLKTDRGQVFPAEDLDLKVIKVWYQNRNGWYSYFGDTGFALCPELLLNDEDLIRVDTEKKANYARLTEKDGRVHERWINPPRQMDVRESKNRPWDTCESFWSMKPNFVDAKTLQPVTLKAGEYKQFFLTVHARKNARPGVYRGAVKVGGFGEVPVEVKVLDFTLPQPKCWADPEKDFLVCSYSYISYGIIMDQNGHDLPLAKQQLKAVLRNQAEHNQSMHSIRGGIGSDEGNYTWDVIREVGMRDDVIMGYMGVSGGDSASRREYAKRAADYIDARFGHHNVYICYGDEPGESWLRQARPVYEDYQREGFKFMIAGSDSVFYKAGYLYDWHNIAKAPTDDSSTKLWNGVNGGNRVAWYANHHIGPENPSFNRRQNGLGAWLAGYTALCNYAHHFGPYNDDRLTYKPMVFAYGTGDGVIDTLGWEGFREGLDDIRYATLMSAMAREAQKSADIETRYLGGKALAYLAAFDRERGDQNAARAEMVKYILDLQAKKVKSPIAIPVAKPFKPSVEPKIPAACQKELDEAIAANKDKNPAEQVRAKARVLGKYWMYEKMAKLYEDAGLYEDLARLYGTDGYGNSTLARPDLADANWLKFIAQTNVSPFAKAEAVRILLPKHPELAKMIPETMDKAAGRNWPNTNTVVSAYEQALGANAQNRTYVCDEAFAAYRAYFDAYVNFAVKGCGRTVHPGVALRAAYMGALSGDEQLAANGVRFLSANPKAPTNDVYLAKLYAASALFRTADDVQAFDAENGGAVAVKVRAEALEKAGSVQQRRANETSVRAMNAYRKSLYKPEPKVCYDVKFSDVPLRNLEDWSGLSVEPEKFVYERKYGGSTDFMVTDVSTGDRGVGAATGEKLENPWMEVVADEWGLHFRFTTPDPKAREVELGLVNGGSFEGYIAPGEDEPYTCILMTPGKEQVGFFNTTYDTFGHRRVRTDDPSLLRFQTFYTDDKVVSCLSLSWANYMERIPTDGKTWDFENMRWTRSGNFCFNGTESIHGRSTWGLLRFELTPAQRAKILKPLLFRAWNAYKKELNGAHGYEGAIVHWRDTAVGDTVFYASKLLPLVKRLKPYEDLMKTDMSDADVLNIAEEALPLWHNVAFEVGRLRAEYLANRIVNPPSEKYKVSCRAATKEAIYAKGENPEFVFSATNDGKPAAGAMVDVTIESPGDRQKKTVQVMLDENGEGKLKVKVPSRSGWVLVTAALGRSKALGGAMYDVGNIKASQACPGDFKKFWEKEIAELKKVPIDAKLTEVPVDEKLKGKVRTWEFELKCTGPRPATGYISLPANAKPKSLPIVVCFQGASGIRAWRSDYYGDVAISLSASKFGLPNGLTDQEYKEKGLYDSDVKGFETKGMESRDTAFFKWMIVRDLRILEYAKSRPEWNGDLVVVNGESLGGGQSLAVGALDPDVDFVCACVPALSDHNGRLVQRHNGWPHLWKVDANGNRPQSAFKVSEAARYVDTMNFCTLYTPNKEVSIGTGFVDTTCPPDGIYAAFNNIPKGVKKTIWTDPLGGHGAGNAHGGKRMMEIFGK